jgi:ubiquinol-cytochrome c reductase iron-sulfur subunit
VPPCAATTYGWTSVNRSVKYAEFQGLATVPRSNAGGAFDSEGTVTATTDHHGHQHGDVTKRDFLYIATGAVGAVGAALTAWPFINQMNPDASVRALASIEVDLAPIAAGQEVTVKWRGNPVIIRNRTPAEIEAAKAVKMEELIDPLSRSAVAHDGDSATDQNRTIAGKEQYLVMMGVCTHLGCVPQGDNPAKEYAVVEGSQKLGGWFCPCHGSHYDTAGRIRKGPAPENLAVPLYSFLSDTKIQIG